MVYAALAFEGALLEQLVRASLGRLPPDRLATRIAVPDDVPLPALDEQENRDWPDPVVSRRIGATWAAGCTSLALVVPSAVARPWGRNLLINPTHPDFARVLALESVELRYDPRLL